MSVVFRNCFSRVLIWTINDSTHFVGEELRLRALSLSPPCWEVEDGSGARTLYCCAVYCFWDGGGGERPGNEVEREIAVVLRKHRDLGPGPQGCQMARRNAGPPNCHHLFTPYEKNAE